MKLKPQFLFVAVTVLFAPLVLAIDPSVPEARESQPLDFEEQLLPPADEEVVAEHPASSGAPQRALGIDDEDVTNYGLRVRVSGRLFDAAKFQVRDLLAHFSEPQSVSQSNFFSEPGGFNTVLDPGYDPEGETAGGVRTTPLQMAWSWRDDFDAANMALTQDNTRRFHILGPRRPGDPGTPCNNDDRVVVADAACDNAEAGSAVASGVLCNQRGVPPYWQASHREHGFFVAADGNCFLMQNVCMHSGGMPDRPDGRNPGGWCFRDTCTAHQFNELGTLCDMDAEWGGDEAQEIYMNVGVFIFPNGHVENAGGGAASGVDGWERPHTLRHDAAGDYFGYVPPRRFGNYTGRDNSLHPYRQSARDGSYRWLASGFPSSPNDYNEENRYSELFGSYFRSGDDIAFYADTRQMQIHSIDRDVTSTDLYGNEAVAGCGEGPVYTGQLDADGDPIYFNARVPQCVRPKSYWHGPPNIDAADARNQWVACDPYDTFLPDGSLNPDRDDDYPIYPGDTGLTCGTQDGDPFSPFDSGGAGTGWSALRMETFDMDTTNDKIDFRLAGNEWRLEMAILFDFATECWVEVSYTSAQCGGRPGYQAKRKWATGTMMIEDLLLEGAARLYSLDDHSCGTAAGDCESPWGPADDGKVRPDRFQIGMDLQTTNINTHPDSGHTEMNTFRAVYQDLTAEGFTCYAEVYDDCVFTLGKGIAGDNADAQPLVRELADVVADQFELQFEDLINGMVEDINESLPNLSSLLGDPWDFGYSLVDVGLFLTGSEGDAIDDPLDPSRKIWTIGFETPPTGSDPIININASLGFRPIAFHPPNAEGIMTVDDPSNGYSADSIFAVPTMYYPNTEDCRVIVSGNSAAHVYNQSSTSWSYDADTGRVTGMTANGHRFSEFLFNRSTWKWSQISFVNKISGHFYEVERDRQGDLGGSSFGITSGWMTLNIQTGNFGDLRVGDQFSTNANPEVVYIITELDAGNDRVKLDLAGNMDGRFTPLPNNANFTIVSRRCSRLASRHGEPLEDQQYDYEDHVVDATWTDPNTGIEYTGRRVIPPLYKEPYTSAPGWCTSPHRAKEDADAMATRFPMDTWLSFDLDADTPPSGTDMLAPSERNTVGVWDYIPGTSVYGGRGVVEQNQNDYQQKEPGDIQYDSSVHVHQRTLNQLAHAVVSSGAGCIEFAKTDARTGEETPWADFMTTDRFAAFFPEIRTQYPGAEVKFRIAPQQTPRIRTGIGNLSYAPTHDGSADIVDEPYTVGVALPDLQMSLWVVDPDSGADIPLFKLNWNTTLGLYLRAMRQCHALDPLEQNNDERCTSTDPLLRTITGYWQLYLDYGNADLGAFFEAPLNSIDGFEAGRFTESELSTTAENNTKFEVVEAYCGEGCDMMGLAQSLVVLLDATASLYLDTRASTDFLSIPLNIDFLYVGPDGPNDDGLGTSEYGSRGDHLGLYFRQLGDFDLMGLAGGMMAPEVRPQAEVPSLEGVRYVTSNAPRLDIGVRNAPGGSLGSGLYTYRINGGFWRIPRSDDAIHLEGLTEGDHVVEVRALQDSQTGFVGQSTPTRIDFTVDTLPPEISIPPSKQGFFSSGVDIQAHDLQTPEEDLIVEYAFNGDDWEPLEGRQIRTRGLPEGVHTLRVQATDLAGNSAVAAREIMVNHSGCGGGCSSSGPGSLVLVFAVFLIAVIRRLMLREER